MEISDTVRLYCLLRSNQSQFLSGVEKKIDNSNLFNNYIRVHINNKFN